MREILAPTSRPLEVALLILALVLIAAYLLYQVRKPSRGVGQLFALAMNGSHAAMTDWALDRAWIDRRSKILDVGCGGGATVANLVDRAPNGTIYGVDHGPGSIAVACRTNARAIAAGRAYIERAAVSKLPYADDVFDLVTAIETQYYWPRLDHDMREILRVLKPGGTLLVVLADYAKSPERTERSPLGKLFRYVRMNAEAQQQTFESAGYTTVQITEDAVHGWLCATGRKPLRT